jgi:hypothetical protein
MTANIDRHIFMDRIARIANIILAIVGLTVVTSAFVILLGICANVGLTFSKCPTIVNT